jgi:hypothetical protein
MIFGSASFGKGLPRNSEESQRLIDTPLNAILFLRAHLQRSTLPIRFRRVLFPYGTYEVSSMLHQFPGCSSSHER